MKTTSLGSTAVCLVSLCLNACVGDLSIPEKKMTGGLKGVIDTQWHIPPNDRPLRLLNSQTTERVDLTTGETGAFLKSDLPPGSYFVQADVPGFAPIREGPIEVLPGQQVDVGTIVPIWLAQTAAEATVTGRVLVQGGATGSGDGGSLSDAGEPASGRASDAQGAKVEFLLDGTNDTIVASSVVDAFGDFSAKTPPGRFTLRVTHPYYVAAIRQGIVVAEGEKKDLSTQPLVLELNPAEVSGTVQRELDQQAMTSPAEGGLVVSDTGVTALVDSSGHFKLSNLAAGQRNWSISLSRHVDPLPARTTVLAAGEKRTVAPVTLMLARGSITGEVEMSDGTPLDQVTVSIPGTTYAAQVSASSSTPNKGRFSLERLPVGAYTVRASRPNYIAANSTTTTVAEGAPVDVGTLRLTRVQGDFTIDDADPTNLAGYSRQLQVTLMLTNVMNAASYRKAEGSAAALSAEPWVPFATPQIAHTLSSADGLKTVFLQFRDSQNNESAPLQGSVFLDTTRPANPALQLANGQDFSNKSNPLTVSLSADESGSGIAAMHLSSVSTMTGGELTGPRQSWVKETSYTRPGQADGGALEEGPVVVYGQLIDNAGNVSDIVSDQVVIDTTGPTGSLLVLRGARATLDGYTASSQVDLAETMAPEPFGGGLKVRLANELLDLPTAVMRPTKARESWALDPVGEGLKTVHYQFVDSAGNVSAAGQATITLDLTPPQVTVVRTSPAVTNSRTVSLQVAAVDNSPLAPLQGLTVSESSLFTGATPAPFPLNGLTSFQVSAADGDKTLFVRVRDAAGNDGIDDSARLRLKQSPPTGIGLTLLGTQGDGLPSSTLTSSTNVTVTIRHTGATQLRLGGASQTDCASAGAYSPLTSNTITGFALPGTGATRTVTACFADEAGNTAGPVSASIDVDATTPTGCSIVLTGRRADDGSAVSSGLDKTGLKDVTWVLSGCSETPADVYLTESAVSCGSASLSFQPFNLVGANSVSLSAIDGVKTVRGCVRDQAHNVGALGADSITVDTTPPQSATLVLDTGAAYVNLAQKTARGGTNRISAVGAATGAVRWALAENATPSTFTNFTGAASNFDFSAGDGIKALHALFMDDVGNITPYDTVDTIEFDTVAPVLNAVEITGKYANGQSATDLTAQLDVVVTVTQTGGSQLSLVDYAAACAAAPYAAWSGGPTAYTMVGAGVTRGVRACVADLAGNAATSLTDTISYDGLAPAGCALTLLGIDAAGTQTTGPLANFTARTAVGVSFSGCSETPTAVYLTEAASVICTNAAPLDWRTLGSGFTHTLSSVDGNKTIRGCVRDAAFNVASFVVDDITLDTTPPAAGSSVTLDGNADSVNLTQVIARGGNIAAASATAPGATTWAVTTTATPPAAAAYVALAGNNPRDVTFSAGDGTKTAYAFFKDALGNSTEAVTIADSIIFDTIAPSVVSTSLAAHGPSQNEYTNTESIVVKLANYPADATTLKLAQAALATTCVSSDFAAAASYPVVPSYTFTLSPGEVTRRMCVQFFDAAGNGSGFVFDTVTVDKTAPSTPVISTPAQYVSLADAVPFNITAAGASVEPAASFSRYEILGGKTSVWTSTSTVQATTSFQFLLNNPMPVAEDGVRNELRLRAVDLAGNISGESVVYITADTNAPDAVPTIRDEWIDNGDGRSTLYWQPSPTGAAGYLVYYGSVIAPVLNGTYAIEGPSPLVRGAQTFVTLSGLPNLVPTYVQVAPFDLAGNIGPATPSSTPKALQPGVVSPNDLATLVLPGFPASTSARPMKAAVAGSYLYVASEVRPSTYSDCPAQGASPCFGMLHTIEMSEMEASVRQGVIIQDAGVPVVVASGTLTFPNDQMVARNFQYTMDLMIDGNLMFVASGRFVHIYNLANPAAPALLADVDLGTLDAAYRVSGVAGLRGNKLILSGRRADDTDVAPVTLAIILDLSSLYDSLASTRPTATDATVLPFSYSGRGSVLSRDRLILAHNFGTNNEVVQIQDGIDNSSGTLWNSGDVQAAGSVGMNLLSSQSISGNLLFSGGALKVTNLKNTWASGSINSGDLVANPSFNLSTQFEVVGDELMTGSGVGLIDISDLTNITQVSKHDGNLGVLSLTWGHYGISAQVIGSSRVTVSFTELVTPRSLTLHSTATGTGGEIEVRPGLVYGGGGGAFDLLTGASPNRISSTYGGCGRMAMFEDMQVNATGTSLTINDLEKSIDRDPSTSTLPFPSLDWYSFSLGATTIAHGIASYGNYLIVAENRATGDPLTGGIWLDVFDARALRDNQSSTSFTLSARVAQLQVVPSSVVTLASLPLLDLTVSQGRAVVSLDTGTTALADNVWFINLNPLFDDDPATTFGPAQVQGSLKTPATRRTVVVGNYAYAATSSGLRIFDVTNAVDPSDATALDASPLSSSLLTTFSFGSIVVYGGYAFLGPTLISDGLYVIDVATQLAPIVVNKYPMTNFYSTCSSGGDVNRNKRGTLDLAGTRLYFGDPIGGLRVFNLE